MDGVPEGARGAYRRFARAEAALVEQPEEIAGVMLHLSTLTTARRAA